MKIFLNHKLVPEEKAVVSVRDHGFLYGDGVYETLRVYSGRVFLLREHLSRLARSLDGIKLRVPWSLSAIGDAVQKTLRANHHLEAVVRVTLTRGPGPYGFDPTGCLSPTLAVESFPFVPYPTRAHAEGIRLAVAKTRRNNPSCLPPSVKSTNCLNGIFAKMESMVLGAQEGLFLTLDGRVSEGTVSNLFIVAGKRVLTPPLDGNRLAGTTRAFVCRLAKRAGYAVEQKDLRINDLRRAGEIFLTNTTMEIMPVSQLAGAGPLIRRPVGPVTRDLMGRFQIALKRFRLTGLCA